VEQCICQHLSLALITKFHFVALVGDERHHLIVTSGRGKMLWIPHVIVSFVLSSESLRSTYSPCGTVKVDGSNSLDRVLLP
jgi:hypothetical protein